MKIGSPKLIFHKQYLFFELGVTPQIRDSTEWMQTDSLLISPSVNARGKCGGRMNMGFKGVLRNCANKDATGKPPDRRNGYDKFWLEYLQMELGVHTWWFCGGHDPSLLAKYELRTPMENIS